MAFTNAIARAIDPESKATAITPDVFVEMQDKAGGEIGNIMARYEVPHDTFGDLSTLTRRDTPDVAKVVDAYVAVIKIITKPERWSRPQEQLRKHAAKLSADPQHAEQRSAPTSTAASSTKRDEELSGKWPAIPI